MTTCCKDCKHFSDGVCVLHRVNLKRFEMEELKSQAQRCDEFKEGGHVMREATKEELLERIKELEDKIRSNVNG